MQAYWVMAAKLTKLCEHQNSAPAWLTPASQPSLSLASRQHHHSPESSLGQRVGRSSARAPLGQQRRGVEVLPAVGAAHDRVRRRLAGAGAAPHETPSRLRSMTVMGMRGEGGRHAEGGPEEASARGQRHGSCMRGRVGP